MRYQRALCGFLILASVSPGVQADLEPRLGEGAVYDTDLNITFLANANLAATETFGVVGINPDGTMTYTVAEEYIGAMNAARHLGFGDWRLSTHDPDCPNINTQECRKTELGHLFYDELSGQFQQDISQSGDPDLSLFSNIREGGAEFYYTYSPAPDYPTTAISFSFSGGIQLGRHKSFAPAFIWPVRDGDVQRFRDVPPDYWAFTFIEKLADSGITTGCGNGNYCPLSPVTRAQMAVFLERGMRGSDYNPPPPMGNIFNDVPATYWAAAFIEQLSLDGITSGCGNNNYCPEGVVTRDQMAVFLLRAKHGSGYSPPPAIGVFDDVPLSHWAVHWIEQLAAEGITAGCGGGNYCPDAPVNRDQMAVFLVRTFGL